VFLEPLVERAEIGMAAVAAAAKAGTLRVDDELHLTPLTAEEEDLEVAKLRTALDRRIGEAQLPELILAVDAEVRFSWIMLGREPRSSHELLMVYAGILAHGTALSAAETARMISASVRPRRPAGHALGCRRTTACPGLRRGAHVHASPRHRDDLGPH
jgi:hypothetical protein